jgi:hypothetical protein
MTTPTELNTDLPFIPFEQWDVDGIEQDLGLHYVRLHPTLLEWLEATPVITDKQREFLLELQSVLFDNVDAWNEEELKMKFISHILWIAQLDQTRYKGFLERPLRARLGNVNVGGKVDYMVATGKTNPKEPFFFLHEYKRSRGRDNDPLGQLLVAMLAARELNTITEPMYGCYVVGRDWFFAVIDGDAYSVSDVYAATRGDDIFLIVGFFQAMKRRIDAHFERRDALLAARGNIGSFYNNPST